MTVFTLTAAHSFTHSWVICSHKYTPKHFLKVPRGFKHWLGSSEWDPWSSTVRRAARWGRWRPASPQQLGWVEVKPMWSPKPLVCLQFPVFSDHADHGGAVQHRARVRTYKLVSRGREQFGSCVLAWCCGKRTLMMLCYYEKINFNVRINKSGEQIQRVRVSTVHCERDHVYLGWTVPFKLSGKWLHQPTTSCNVALNLKEFLSVFPLRWASLCSWT